jgi:hypothetical protein
MKHTSTFTVFAGDRCIASGALPDVLLATKACLEGGERKPVLLFDDDSGKQVDFDLRGTPDEIVARAAPALGPGRPKLGVVAREVTLLPRHWDWLEAQPNGISATLRRLVEEARKRHPEEQSARRAIDAASRVMTSLAGDRRGYEEASRALFARDRKRFDQLIRPWPVHIREHLQRLVRGAMRVANERSKSPPR